MSNGDQSTSHTCNIGSCPSNVSSMVDSIAVTYVGAIRNLQSRAGDY